GRCSRARGGRCSTCGIRCSARDRRGATSAPPSIRDSDARDRRGRRLPPQYKITDLVQEALVILAHHGAGPARHFLLDRLIDELLDDAAAHRDMAAVLDRLARKGLL